MSDIPHYFLYGEATPSEFMEGLHIAFLEESLPKHNFEIHPHRHDNLHQLLIVEQGSVLAQINERCREETGPCILSIPPKEVHGFVHQPDVKGYIITISQSFLMQLFSETEREEFQFIFRTPLVARLEPDRHTVRAIEYLGPQLMSEFASKEVAQSSMIGAYLKVLFVLLRRSLKPESNEVHQQDERIAVYEQFMTLLEDHYLQHWSVDQYADVLGFSAGRLNRLCQRYSGQNAMQIIHERLLTEAKRQLIYTQLSSKEICYKLGFKDPGYFSRFFSRHTGITPGKYKKQVREQGTL